MTQIEMTRAGTTQPETAQSAGGQLPAGTDRPSFAVWKFASCDGCQLSLLNCEDELLAVAGAIRIAHFPEATRARVEGPYDVSLVEGSISTPEDVDRIHRVRAVSRRLVAIGACATSGGIQALRNYTSLDRLSPLVYAHPEYVATLERSTPVSAHVTVDVELRGCPIDKNQLVEVISAVLAGRRPRVPRYSVCAECKRQGITCLMVAHGTPCLGPVTQAGCGAVCPRTDRGCYGCFGPQDAVNTAPLAERLAGLGMSRTDVARAFRTYNAAAEPFRRESLRQEEVTAR
jgi:sulfhydrogenase subunit delta